MKDWFVLCLKTFLDVMQCCLARQNISNMHGYIWILRENSVDEVPQFLQQYLPYLHLLTGQGRQDFMIDLPILVLFQQTDGLAFHDRPSRHVLMGNEVAIRVVPIRSVRPQDKAIRIGIRPGDPACPLVLQGFFIRLLIEFKEVDGF